MYNDIHDYPLRKVVSKESKDGRTYEHLECGHRRLYSPPGPGQLHGEWPAKRRRCRQCPKVKGGERTAV